MTSKSPSYRHERATTLAEGYTPMKRRFEILMLSIFTLFWVASFIRISRWYVHSSASPFLYELPFILVALAIGIALVDFISGVLHWALDTWGDASLFAVGIFIRSFREHHLDQMAITRHDFIETNGDTTIPCLPGLLLLWFLGSPLSTGGWFPLHWPSIHVIVLSMTLAGALTNQTHKSAHCVYQPPIISFLMRHKILLSPQEHRKHHCGNFDRAYCITTGWMNPPLDYINFWRKAEDFITTQTGAIPRANDAQLLSK